MFLLSSRAVLRFHGSAVCDFLNRLFTCNLLKLKNGEFTFGCLLNSKGRFLFDFFVYKNETDILVDIAQSAVEDFKKAVLYYDITNEIKHEVLQNAKVLASHHFIQNWKNGVFEGRFIDFVDESEEYKPEEIYDIERIKNCLPDGVVDLIVGRSIILECNYEEAGAIDFNKGCYVGQEFITMAKRLGDIKKCLVCVEGYNKPFSLVLVYKDEARKGEIVINEKIYKIWKQ